MSPRSLALLMLLPGAAFALPEGTIDLGPTQGLEGPAAVAVAKPAADPRLIHNDPSDEEEER